MLEIKVPGREFYDELSGEFASSEPLVLLLEHSLVSISKWEAEHCKPFLGAGEKSAEETADYIRCMTITKEIKPEIFRALPADAYRRINTYINAPMTATWFGERPGAKKSREIVTSELIYYWMIKYGVPIECQKWHINRLLTLIQVCSIKSQPPEKIGGKGALATRRALNDARRKQLNTKG